MAHRIDSTDTADRIPPGQYLTEKFPVLTYGPTPQIEPADWSIECYGAVESPTTLDWDDLMAMRQVEWTSDFHCVTTWSRLDNRWTGVPIRDVLALVRPRPEARFVMAHAYGGYTTNMPFEVLDDDDVLLAHRHDGRPLSREHGYPVRLVVPKRYAWKSCKWIRALEFMEEDRAGFWERNGYSVGADPWIEERYW